ncbi:hypothetical protein ACFLW6_04735 [Chloroflexota bacterium]
MKTRRCFFAMTMRITMPLLVTILLVVSVVGCGTKSYEDGYTAGFQQGYDQGWHEGYEKGAERAASSLLSEIIPTTQEPSEDYLVLMYLGGFFLVFGIVLMTWGFIRKEDDSGSVSPGSDVRRYLEPQSNKSVPIIIGGLLALVCGLALLAVGIVF